MTVKCSSHFVNANNEVGPIDKFWMKSWRQRYERSTLMTLAIDAWSEIDIYK
jgi:hypothetical protein